MTVLAKINSLREHIHSTKLEKTGHNKFSGYHYFELSDFLVPALKKCFELNLCAVVSFTADLATMTVTDLDDGSQFIITSPMSSANLKACHEVQNLGAVQTYLRRYLWVALLEIVEHDALNIGQGAKKPKTSSETGVTVEDSRKPELDSIAADLVAMHQAKQDAKAIAIWYADGTFADNEERLYVWGLLREYSALRRVIKANAPKKEEA